MYEFSDKEIRKKFKETEYGKRTNLYLYISIGVLGAIVLMSIITFALTGFNFEVIIPIAIYFSTPLFISIVLMCYFDGKRDGAIEQFKADIKK